MKHRTMILLAVVLLLAAVLATRIGAETNAASGEGAYRKITAEQAKEMMDEGGVVVVDVRRADEYAAGHIPGAINIPNEDIGQEKPSALRDPDAALIVYCRTGIRSKQASDKLVAMGYRFVNDMGGIVSWPYETVAGSEPGESAAQAETGVLGSFTAADLNGNAVDQSVLQDYELTMVNVWATYCGPCLSEMPDLGELAGEYKDKGMQVIGIVSDAMQPDGAISDNKAALARDLAGQTHADFTHLLPSESLLPLLYQINAVPTTFFVDGEGRQVGSTYLGARSKAQWAEEIDKTLSIVRGEM